MARVRIVRDEPSPDDWLASVSDRVLACKAQQHAWPKIKRQGRLPRGIRATLQGQGQVQLEYVCPDCGTSRVTVTAPAGQIEYPRRYRYSYPEGYAAPKGADITRRQLFDELWRRTLEDIRLQADRPATEADPAPAARFSSGGAA